MLQPAMVSLLSPKAACRFREAAVVFSVNISQSQLIKFRIRLSGVPDRISLCLAVSEFVEIRESPPTQNGSQTQFSSGGIKYSDYLNSSQSSYSQPNSLFQESKCGSFSSTINASVDLDSGNNYKRSTSYSYQGRSEDMCSNYSTYTPPSRSSFSPYPPCTQRYEMQDAVTQTDPKDVFQSSPEEIQSTLTLLLKDPSFQWLVQKINQMLPELNPLE